MHAHKGKPGKSASFIYHQFLRLVDARSDIGKSVDFNYVNSLFLSCSTLGKYSMMTLNLFM